MVKKEITDMLCLQETKVEQMDKSICQALWGDLEVCWELQPTLNRVGGLLCLWSEQSSFRMERKTRDHDFIYLEGMWVPDGQKMSIVNIYSPCDVAQKRNLWEQIRQLRNSSFGGLWCIHRDFNSVRNLVERVRICQRGVYDSNVEEFSDWIAELDFEDVPCVGRKFTWYKPNGTAKSTLDRVLVSAECFEKWQGCIQFIIERNFQDHCPVLLKSENIDWAIKFC